MAKPRFSEAQIIGFIDEVEAGASILDLCRRHRFSNASFYNWRAKYGTRSLRDKGSASPPESSEPVIRLWPAPAWAGSEEKKNGGERVQ